LRILIISASYKPAYIYGGPTMSISQLAENLVEFGGHNVSVYTTTANGKSELDIESNICHSINGVQVTYFDRITKDHSHFSPKLYLALWQNIQQFDIIHLQAWWHLVSVFSALICIIKKKTFVLSPRGTLSNYSFNNKTSFLKKAFHTIIGKHILLRSKFLLTSKKEEDDLIKLLKKSICTSVLPNFVKVDNLTQDLIISDIKILKLLFLSRIEEKKGLEFLFKALEKLSFIFELTVAGSGNSDYINSLKQLAIKLNLNSRINWIGQVNPDEKFKVLNQHHLLILPSYDENFANVIIESLSVGTAVLTTYHVGLADFVINNDLGWVCKQDSLEINQTLEKIHSQSEKLKLIKSIAPEIIRKAFEPAKLTNRYIQYYNAIIAKFNH
jgi:glycosyltransferase involved in cell wall biosynthesis